MSSEDSAVFASGAVKRGSGARGPINGRDRDEAPDPDEADTDGTGGTGTTGGGTATEAEETALERGGRGNSEVD